MCIVLDYTKKQVHREDRQQTVHSERDQHTKEVSSREYCVAAVLRSRCRQRLSADGALRRQFLFRVPQQATGQGKKYVD